MREELLIFRSLDVDESADVVKSDEGWVFGLIVSNTNAAARYLKIYDKETTATEANTPKITFLLPPTSTVHFSIPNGIRFVNGIWMRATTAIADADTGAPGAGDVAVNAFYL